MTPNNFRIKNGLTVSNGVTISAGNVVITSGQLVIGATAINATSLSAEANNAYTNAITIAANASNLTSGTVAIARIPTADSVSNTSISHVPTANNVKTAYDAAIAANTNANTALTAAGAAYTNAVSYTDTKIGTANTAITGNAATAYTNAVSYTDTKIGTANTAMAANADAAYTNATIFAANASNANNGTLAEARLPHRMNQDVRTSDSPTFVNMILSGNLTVSGTRTYVNTTTLDVGDNIVTLNADLGANPPTENAGLEIMRGTSANVQFLWDETNDRWTTNNQEIAISSLVANGAASGITTLTTGNTTITGFANVSSTLNVTGNVKTGAVVAVNTVASAWANTAKVVQVGSASVWNYQDETNVFISQNYFFNGTTYKYIQDGEAAGYSMQGGNHNWSKAPSGIANANVTLTSIMALYSNGNLAVSGTINAQALEIKTINATSHGATLTSNSTTAILILGNSSVFTTTNSSTFSGTANNSTNFDGSSLATIQGQITGNAATAYTNAVSYTDTKIGTANTAITGNAATAYTNAVSYTDGKIGTANTAITGNAATAYANAVSYTDTKIGTANTAMAANADAAYTNAIAIAANATNLTSGTVNIARIPTVDAVNNTSISFVATANSVKTAYDAAIFASNDANAAIAEAGMAYTNAIAIAANATNLTSGTVNSARLPSGNSTISGAVLLVDSTSNTSTTAAASAASVKSAYDAAIAANTLANTAATAASAAYTNAVSYTDGKILTSNSAITGNAATAYTNAVSYTDTKIGTANSAITGNAATAYTNAVSYTDTKIGTANTAITGNAATAYTNAIAIAANGSNITSGTVAFARLPSLFIGTTTIQSTSAAQAVSGITTLAAGNTTITGDMTVSGNLTINGTTTNINSTNLVVEDKNIVLADVTTPSDITADGGGITLKGGTDKTFNWVDATDSWTSSEHLDIATGKTYRISGTTIANSTALGTGILASSLTSVGTLTTLAAGNTTITGNLSVTSVGSFDRVTTANNGSGTNIAIGDDAWFGDVNISDTVRIAGQQSANNGFIIFGNADNSVKLGRTGTGALTWNGAFSVTGGLTTLSANLVMANNNITRPILTGYTEHEVANAAATGTFSLDCGAANFFDLTLTGNITISPTNVPPATRVWSGTIAAKQDATGGRTITWPAGTKYAGGVVPPATTTANALDIWSIMTYDGGTTYIVSLSVKAAA